MEPSIEIVFRELFYQENLPHCREYSVILREVSIFFTEIPPVTKTQFGEDLALYCERGHLELLKWLAPNFNAVHKNNLLSAARYGHGELCQLAKDWGANDFNVMLRITRIMGYVHLQELAEEWLAEQ